MKRLLAFAALAMSAATSHATPVRYDFTVTYAAYSFNNPTVDPSVGGYGYVIFDPGVFAPSTGSGFVGNNLTPLPSIDIFFSWHGVSFDQSSAGLFGVNFVNGAVDAIGLDGLAIGGCLTPSGCLSNGDESVDDFFLGTNPGQGGIALLTILGNPRTVYGDVAWSVTPIPVPGAAVLFAGALGTLGMFQRCLGRHPGPA